MISVKFDKRKGAVVAVCVIAAAIVGGTIWLSVARPYAGDESAPAGISKSQNGSDDATKAESVPAPEVAQNASQVDAAKVAEVVFGITDNTYPLTDDGYERMKGDLAGLGVEPDDATMLPMFSAFDASTCGGTRMGLAVMSENVTTDVSQVDESTYRLTASVKRGTTMTDPSRDYRSGRDQALADIHATDDGRYDATVSYTLMLSDDGLHGTLYCDTPDWYGL